MLKAAAWRLAKIIHQRPADVLNALAGGKALEDAFPGRAPAERQGDAARLVAKIARLRVPAKP